MQTREKLKILKVFLILIAIFFAIILLIYLVFIVPEYLACNKVIHEGENGIDIWGSEVDCRCESKDIGEAFFQLFSIIVLISSFVLTIICIYFRKLKRKYESEFSKS